jgi:hypothetical protein
MIVPIWNRQHNIGHSRRNAVASLNQPRQPSKRKVLQEMEAIWMKLAKEVEGKSAA